MSLIPDTIGRVRTVRNTGRSPGLGGGGGSAAVVGRGVVVVYDGTVGLQESDFVVPAGSVTSVIGPNGSGKSTVLNAIAGLATPRRGSLEVLGGRPEDRHDRVAYVLQATRMNERLPVTVHEVVAMGRYARRGMFHRLSRDDRVAVDEAMERLHIGDLAQRHLRELSGGQRQRVFVAQGLVQQAELLLLDEPLTGLDIPSHERIDEVIEDEQARGATLVVTTHDVAEARRSDHVLLMGGRVLREGPPGDVLTDEALVEAYGAQLLHVHEPMVVDDPHHTPAPSPAQRRDTPKRGSQ